LIDVVNRQHMGKALKQKKKVSFIREELTRTIIDRQMFSKDQNVSGNSGR